MSTPPPPNEPNRQIVLAARPSGPVTPTRSSLNNRLELEAFSVAEPLDQWPGALAALGRRFAAGGLEYRETVAEGLERAPEAFIGLLAGKNFGKQLVKSI